MYKERLQISKTKFQINSNVFKIQMTKRVRALKNWSLKIICYSDLVFWNLNETVRANGSDLK